MEAVRSIVPGTNEVELFRLREQYPDAAGKLEQAATSITERILAGSWEMLGHDYDLRAEIDWHADPKSGHCFQRVFFKDVQLQSAARKQVDVKHVWELGRQQYVVELARGSMLCGSQEASRLVQDIVLKFSEQNPLYEGVHWTSALEVAMRSISWIWMLATQGAREGWQEDELDTVAARLVDHAEYLKHHFEFYSSPYNHLIGEATALYLLGHVLKEHPQARHWRERSRKVLIEHGPRQFYDDGFCVEQATSYHYYTLGFLTMAILAARQAKEPLTELEPVLHQAFLAGLAFRQPNGSWPAIGDLDSARSIPVHHDDFWDFESLHNLAAVVFDDGRLKIADSGPGEEVFWLLGCRGVEKWYELESAFAPASVLLEHSGYAIGQNEQDWLLFDAGPVAHGLFPDATPSTAHGHADTLQVLYCHHGRPILVDSGMPFYIGSNDLIEYFRGTASHNTLSIEDSGPARDVGKLAWSHVTPTPKLSASFLDDIWLFTAQASWPGEVNIERHILGIPGIGLWIADHVKTSKPRKIRWHWHLGEDAELRQVDSGSYLEISNENEICLAAWSESGMMAPKINTSKKGSPMGLRATSYGKQSKGMTIQFESHASGDAVCVMFVGASRASAMVDIGGYRVCCCHPKLHQQEALDLNHEVQEKNSGSVTWRVNTPFENMVIDSEAGVIDRSKHGAIYRSLARRDTADKMRSEGVVEL